MLQLLQHATFTTERQNTIHVQMEKPMRKEHPIHTKYTCFPRELSLIMSPI